jgi:uncharacterized membrane protein YciS (DUF1049 family)
MKDDDDKIREALRKEDVELPEQYCAEASLHESLIETFRGLHRWASILVFIGSCAIFLLLFVIAYQFFQAESTRAMIAWATGFLWGVMWIVMLKIWFYVEVNKNSITREIKRLELQLANLSRQLGAKK